MSSDHLGSEPTVMTLGLVIRDDKILLGMKKRGFGKGYWNGFGGKLQPGENLADGMRRELFEETSLEMLGARRVAFLEFSFESGENLLGHVFYIDDFAGEPEESDEMRPEWFLISDIPYHEMWEDDSHWLPLVLDQKKVAAQFHFSSDHRLLKKNVEILSGEEFPDLTGYDFNKIDLSANGNHSRIKF